MRIHVNTKKLLFYIAAGGILAVAASSPYFWMHLAKKYMEDQKLPSDKKRARRTAQALASARRSKLIILRKENGKFMVELSEQGKRKIKEIEFEGLSIPTPQKWDKKWRVVIFDIPEKGRGRFARQALAEKLRRLGFVLFQKSVWVYPYPCENEVKLVAENFCVSEFVHVIVAESLSNDAKLYSYFDL